MAHSFKTSSGRASFGVFKEAQDAGDYTLNKKAQTTFCSANVCVPSKTVVTQGNLLMLNRANQLKYYSCKNSFNKSNLNVNLITKLDLLGVPVIQNTVTGACPTDLSLNAIPYLDYTIDPSGNLFGNNVCGINNYVNYMVYNAPNPNFIN